MADTSLNNSDHESESMSGVWRGLDREERNETQLTAWKPPSSEESESENSEAQSPDEKRQDPEAPSPEEQRSKKCAKLTGKKIQQRPVLPETGFSDIGYCSSGDDEMKQLASCTHSAEKWLKAKEMAEAKLSLIHI